MNDNETKCPICGCIMKKRSRYHTECIKRYVNELTMEKKQKIVDLYNGGYSMVDMSNYLGFKYHFTEKVLAHLGLNRRTVSEAKSQQRCKDKYKASCMEHYGTPHNFSRDCQSRKDWEKRLLDEEGITNVFQRDDVKEKIKATMLERYGEDGVFEIRRKGNFVEYYIEKYGEEKGREYFEWVQKRKGTSGSKEHFMEVYGAEWEEKWKEYCIRMAKHFVNNCGLNNKCEEILIKHNIEYEKEFLLLVDMRRWYRYDFKIGNLIIELNGVYWHCSPKKYKPNDLVKFPNNTYIRAKDKWEYDETKNNYARSKGYTVVVIWEDDFSEDILLKVLNDYKDETSKN